MNDEYDLNEIQARVNTSKDAFVDALKHYDSYDGNQIIERFLAIFEDRADVTMELRRETEDLIRRFNSRSASLATNIVILHMRLNATVLSIELYILGNGIDVMGRPIDAKGKLSPMELLKEHQKRIEEAQAAIRKTWEWANKTVYEIGVHTERIELMAAEVIRGRTLMMRAFKDENIGTSLKDLGEQLRNKQYARSGIAVLDGAFERIFEMSKELAKFLVDENPIFALVNLAKKLGSAAKGKEVDTSRGGTELMNMLLSQLRIESKIIESIGETYEAALKEFDSVDAAIRA